MKNDLSHSLSAHNATCNLCEGRTSAASCHLLLGETGIVIKKECTRPTPQNPLPFPVAKTRTGSDGIYEVRNIRPGEYYLTISCAFCATLNICATLNNGGQGSLMRMAICLAVLLGLTDLTRMSSLRAAMLVFTQSGCRRFSRRAFAFDSRP